MAKSKNQWILGPFAFVGEFTRFYFIHPMQRKAGHVMVGLSVDAQKQHGGETVELATLPAQFTDRPFYNIFAHEQSRFSPTLYIIGTQGSAPVRTHQSGIAIGRKRKANDMEGRRQEQQWHVGGGADTTHHYHNYSLPEKPHHTEMPTGGGGLEDRVLSALGTSREAFPMGKPSVTQNQLHLAPSIRLGLRKKPDGNVMYGHDFIRSGKQQTALTLENLLKFNQQFVKSPSTAPIQGGHAAPREKGEKVGWKETSSASGPAEKSWKFPFALKQSHLAAQTHKGPDATSAFEPIGGSKAQNMGISPQMPFLGTLRLATKGTAQMPSQGTVQFPSQGTAKLHLKGTAHLPPEETAQFLSKGTERLSSQGTAQMPSQGTDRLPSQGTAKLPSQGYAVYGFEHTPQQNMQMPAMPQLSTRTIENAGSSNENYKFIPYEGPNVDLPNKKQYLIDDAALSNTIFNSENITQGIGAQKQSNNRLNIKMPKKKNAANRHGTDIRHKATNNYFDHDNLKQLLEQFANLESVRKEKDIELVKYEKQLKKPNPGNAVVEGYEALKKEYKNIFDNMAIFKGKISRMNTDIAQKTTNSDFDHLQKQLDYFEFERKKKEFLLGFYKEQMQGAHPVPKTVSERYEELKIEDKKIFDNLAVLREKISSLKKDKNANEVSKKRRKISSGSADL